MDVLHAVILGIIEGLSEFLPISSTGHLVIAMPALGLDASQAPWNVLLWVSQFAAILAVIVYFWRDLWRRTFHPPLRGVKNHLLVKLVVAMIPTIILALLFKDFLDPLEQMPAVVAVALILGAGAIELIDRTCRREIPQEIEDIKLWQALAIGAIQAISMIPGVSRAGATIMGGMALGLTPRVATEFSFYLAIPTMLGAAVKTVHKYRGDLTADNAGIVLLGSVVSFVVALIVVAWFLGFVKRHRFTVFAVYRTVLGVAVLVAMAAGWLRT